MEGTMAEIVARCGLLALLLALACSPATRSQPEGRSCADAAPFSRVSPGEGLPSVGAPACTGPLGLVHPPPSLPAGDAVAAADLDRDGATDLVVLGDTTVSVLPGNGDGTFRGPLRAVAVPGAWELQDPTLADLDGDGLEDLLWVAVLRDGVDELQLARGLGGGAFAAPVAIERTTFVWSPVVTDLDGDGRPDLAYTTSQPWSSERTLVVRRGADAFASARSVVGGTADVAAAADLDGDGRTDLVLEDGDRLLVLPGAGDGTFGPARSISAGPFLEAHGRVAAADLDGDGDVDLATLEGLPSPLGGVPPFRLAIHLNTGAGTFAPPDRYVAGLASTGVVARDLDGDGAVDVAYADRSALAAGTVDLAGVAPPATVRVHRGRGDGSLLAPADHAADGPRVVAADLDGDGRLDLAAGATLLRAVGAGAFEGRVPSSAFDPGAIAAGRLGPAGAATVAVVERAASRAGVFSVDREGAFRRTASLPTPGPPWTLAVGDLDRDGLDDVVVSAAGDLAGALAGIHAFLQRPGGGFAAAPVPSGTRSPTLLALGDLDRDGTLDLVAGDANTHTLGIHVFLGNGDGTFRAARAPVFAEAIPEALALGDFDGDGVPDVAAGVLVGRLLVLPGNGDGTFAPPVELPSAGAATALAAADLDRDGRDELAVVHGALDVLRIFAGAPRAAGAPRCWDELFRAPTDLATGRGPGPVVAADVDGDGALDLAVVERGAGTVGLFRGAGDGRLLRRVAYATMPSPHALAFVDATGDGRASGVTASASGLAVSVPPGACAPPGALP